MAITNSIAIGTGKKKLGEIVLATVKGRTIARKYQPNVANPNTPGQVDQRSKMANMVIAYHALKPIIRGAFVNRKRYQSAYNAFVQANVSQMPVMRFGNANAVFAMSPTMWITGGQLGEMISSQAAPDETEFNFNSFSSELKVGDVFRAAKYNFSTEKLEFTERILAPGDITAGIVNVVWDDASFGVVFGYIITADRKKSSTNKALYYI